MPMDGPYKSVPMAPPERVRAVPRWHDGPVLRGRARTLLIPSPRRLAAGTVVAALLLGACTTTTPEPDPDTDSGLAAAAAALAEGLSRKDVTSVPFSGATGAAVDEQLQPLVAGMGPLAPTVTVAGVEGHGDGHPPEEQPGEGEEPSRYPGGPTAELASRTRSSLR